MTGADFVDLDLVVEAGSMVDGVDVVLDRPNMGVDLVVGFQVVELISNVVLLTHKPQLFRHKLPYSVVLQRSGSVELIKPMAIRKQYVWSPTSLHS